MADQNINNMLSSNSARKNLKRARERLSNFSARGSSCPLCKKDFRNGCNHSIEQAINRLNQNIINAMVDIRLSKYEK